MSLVLHTLIISTCMILLGFIPFFSTTVRKHSRFFYLLGTGALTGILVFDLLPDLMELGGTRSLISVGVVWVLYSLLHLSHLKHHKSELEPEVIHHAHSHQAWFLTSMIAHCMASGMLLVAAEGLSEGLNHTIFWALLAHKAYESLTVSSVLLDREKTKRGFITSVTLYALSLPAGVILTFAFRSSLTATVAMIALSLASGTLLGCLIFDFFLPSLRFMKNRWASLGWMAIGLATTQLLLKVF